MHVSPRRSCAVCVACGTEVHQKCQARLAQMDENRKADDYATPALFLDESKRLEDALQLMQKTGHRMAVVVDRRKKEIGIICLQDIVKVIFGEVRL